MQTSGFTTPMIPQPLMHDMYQIKMTNGSYDMDHGGQWHPGEEERIKFKGTILPVGDKDLIYIDAGAYTRTSRKLYTNGHALKVNEKVYDPKEEITYTVKQELSYNSIHPIRRYLIDEKEGAAQR